MKLKSLKRLLSLSMALVMLLALNTAVSAASFSDVPAGTDYAEAVRWAAGHGYVNGYNDGRFGVSDNVTRAQLSAILYRAAGSPAASAQNYADEGSIASYAQTAVDWSRANNIIAARSGGRFDPAAPATRAEIVSALYNYMGRAGAPSAPGASGNGRVLVAYFSASGNTEAVAKTIAETLNADTFELVPADPYTDDDLNWTVSGSRVNREHENPAWQDVKLEKNTVDNWADYDVVFIGYPIWWGVAAWPVKDFVKNNDFSGKTVVPFCTSASSGLGESGALLEEMAKGGSWLEGQRFFERASDAAAWASGLDLPKASVRPARMSWFWRRRFTSTPWTDKSECYHLSSY